MNILMWLVQVSQLATVTDKLSFDRLILVKNGFVVKNVAESFIFQPKICSKKSSPSYKTTK